VLSYKYQAKVKSQTANQCAGYWREDSRSMMATYDRDDPYINYQSWLYERRDLTTI
jgi:hypothetical protein